MMWYPTTAVNSDLTLHRLDAFIYHTVPAKLLDIAARLTGRRPRMVILNFLTYKRCFKLFFFL